MRKRYMSQITDGTAQDGRFPVALNDHYFNVDERSFENVVSRTAEFAKAVNYYRFNSGLQAMVKDGHWEALFAADEVITLSDILSIDSRWMEAEFLPLLEKDGSPVAAARYLIGFANRINSWYISLLKADDHRGSALSKHLEATVNKKLSPFIADVARLLHRESHNRTAAAGLHLLSQFHPMWQHHGPAHSHLDDVTLIRSTFYSLVSAVSNLKPIAAEELTRSMQTRKHESAAALVLAFAKLLDVAKEKLNRFTARHRDFYYTDVLRMKPNPLIADSAFLVMRAGSGSPVHIPAGTAFAAGKTASGTGIVYTADSDLRITDAQVRELYTLFCSRDPQISPEIYLHYICAMRAASIPPGPASGFSWPLFGADKPEVQVSGDDARIGFAIASPSLLLREGHRKISINLSFRIPPDPAKVPAGQEGDAIKLGKAMRRMIFGQDPRTAFTPEQKEFLQKTFTAKDLLRQDPVYVFQRIVGEAFTIDLTVEAGWYSVPGHTVSLTVGNAGDPYQITYTLTLGPDAPAIAAWNPQVHLDEYNTKLPIVRFRINPKASVYPYSLLRDLQVEEITVESEVSDALNNLAWNQNGQLDTSKPFNPFGPLPAANSYLVVGNYDAARADLKKLTLNLEWGNLPDTVGGFKEYYKGYRTSYSNDGFVAELSVLRDGRWQPEERVPTSTLFDTDPEGQKVAESKSITLDVAEDFRRLDPTVVEEQFRYDQKARTGFFRIALTAPRSAFGHAEYPVYLSQALSENALRMGRMRLEPLPLPNSPYTPIINRMTLDYKAQSVIRAGATAGVLPEYASRAYYIRPFGVSAVSEPWTMLPIYRSDGNLLIGLSATNPRGRLTLFFQLREDSVTGLSSTPAPVSWFYLASDKWQKLENAQIISDTTDGFLTSGIVTLDLPGDIDLNNTVMPPNLYWIRAAAQRNLDSFCSLYSVQSQAVRVTHQTTEASVSATRPIPAGTIAAPLKSIVGLISVSQPLPSSGGREPETPRQMITRTAERLHHKGRASTPWDYERLVLENFPEVFKAKCFPAMNSCLLDDQEPSASSHHSRHARHGIPTAPGSVLVVVVPQQKGLDTARVFDPMLDANQLKRIQELLQSSSPQVRIEVRNPVYERIMIRCAVKFTTEASREKGRYLDRLAHDIIDYISPWSGVGAPFRFGWSFRKEEVEAYVSKLSYVDFVTKFSMLHITRSDLGNYRLEDTARKKSIDDVDRITPAFPWSLAIPNLTHILETTDSTQAQDAVPTVIGNLVIGNTFIVADEKSL